MPSLNHSYLCTQILKQLAQNPKILALVELTLDIDNGLTPDICVYPAASLQPNFFEDVTRVSQMPILAIEVISANQNIQDLLHKAKRFVQAGVKTVWVLEPYGRTVFVTIADQDPRIARENNLETDGIAIDFAALFVL
ncbi:MAG: Uma2 family endonuclease [Prochlorotrichaceae cyanobacterium]|jgi:Uma2 family endonuclease